MNRTIVNQNNNRFYCGVRNNLTGLVIPFPVMPDGISESISANFTQQDIIGASRPRIVYSSTGAKTLSLSLKNLTEDYIMEGFANLLQYVRALQALAYPEYSSAIVKSPDLTLFLGEDRTMSCVCTSVSVTWGSTVKDQRITTCSVDLNFLMTRPSIPGATDVQNIG